MVVPASPAHSVVVECHSSSVRAVRADSGSLEGFEFLLLRSYSP